MTGEGGSRWRVLRRQVGGMAMTLAGLTVAACSSPTQSHDVTQAMASGQSGSDSPSGTTSGDGSTSAPTTSSAASAGSSSASSATRGLGAGQGSGPEFAVVSVVDGDTIKVRIDGVKTPIRLIGVDTPETHKPGAPVECFGPQASSHMQSLVQSKQVQLVSDPTQGDRDHYGRLLRHVYVGGSTNVALAQIGGGFGREYTYRTPYAHRDAYRSAEKAAQDGHRGTWGPPCRGFHAVPKTSGVGAHGAGRVASEANGPEGTRASSSGSVDEQPRPGCDIKGNVSRHGEKIAHLPGSRTYGKTRVDITAGERWFCSQAEAVAAGWRVAHD